MSVGGPWWRKYVNDWRTTKSASKALAALKQISAENKRDARTTGLCSWEKKGSLTKFLKGWRMSLLRCVRLLKTRQWSPWCLDEKLLKNQPNSWKKEGQAKLWQHRWPTLPGRPVAWVVSSYLAKPVKKSRRYLYQDGSIKSLTALRSGAKAIITLNGWIC